MSGPYRFQQDSARTPLDRRPPQPFASGQQPNFKTNVNRAKTKKWVEAKKTNYDGDDWGEYDEYDEYGVDTPPAQPEPSQQYAQPAPQGRNFTDPQQRQQGYGDLGRRNSFDRGDEARAFSAAHTPIQSDPYTDAQRGFGPPPPQVVPRQYGANRQASGADSDISDTLQHRQDFDSSALPPPLHTRISPAPGNPTSSPQSYFPPRKSSIGQSESPVTMSTRDRAPSNPQKALPIIRPADIYKRHAEEQRRRASEDSSRPSLDSLSPAHDGPSDPYSKAAADASRALQPLETVAERRSEYIPNVSQESQRFDSSKQSMTSTQPFLPPIEHSSSFGPDILPKGSGVQTPAEQKQADPGFRAVVDTAFTRKDDHASSVPPTPVSKEPGSSVSRSNTDSTSGISPIMSRVPSSATSALKIRNEAGVRGSTPVIAEENSEGSTPVSRPPSTTAFGGPYTVARKPSPSQSRNPSSTSLPRYLANPSPGGSPARSPAFAPQTAHPEPEIAHLGTLSPTSPETMDDGPSSGFATREADLASAVRMSPPGTAGPDLGAAERESQTAFLETHPGTQSPIRDNAPRSRSQSPSKSRVAELAGKFGDVSSSRRDSWQSNVSRNSVQSWERSGENSRPVSPTKRTSASERPALASEPSFRPKLPGQWESYATNVPSSAEQSGPASRKGSVPGSQELGDIDLTPTTAKHPVSTPSPTKTSPTLTEDPLAALKAAGAAMGEAISASVGMGSNSDNLPDYHDQQVLKDRTTGNVYLSRPVQLERGDTGISSVASSLPPTPPAKDTPQSEFPPPPPLKERAPDSSPLSSQQQTPVRPAMVPQLSTEPSEDDQESDKLRKAIVMSLSPLRTSETATSSESQLDRTSLQPGAPTGTNRESSILPSEYDSYWADGGHGTPRQSHDTSRGIHEQVPTSSNQSPVAANSIAPQLGSPPVPPSLITRFSWEDNKTPRPLGLAADDHTQAGAGAEPVHPAQEHHQTTTTMSSPARDNARASFGGYPEPYFGPSHAPATGVSELPAGPEIHERSPTPPPASEKPVTSPTRTLGSDIDRPSSRASGLHVVNDALHPEAVDLPPRLSAEIEPPLEEKLQARDGLPALPGEQQPGPSSDVEHFSAPAPVQAVAPDPTLNSPKSPTSDKVLGYREIINLKSSSDRIATFNKTRDYWANTDHGLSDWMSSALASNPDLATQAPVARPNINKSATSRHKATPSLSLFGKHGSPFSNSNTPPKSTAVADQDPTTPTASNPGQGRPGMSGRSTSVQMKKGKDLLHSAEMLGGKGMKGAKGLFAKGKSRFSKDKEPNPVVPSLPFAPATNSTPPAPALSQPSRHISQEPEFVAPARSSTDLANKRRRFSNPFSRSRSRPTSVVLPSSRLDLSSPPQLPRFSVDGGLQNPAGLGNQEEEQREQRARRRISIPFNRSRSRPTSVVSLASGLDFTNSPQLPNLSDFGKNKDEDREESKDGGQREESVRRRKPFGSYGSRPTSVVLPPSGLDLPSPPQFPRLSDLGGLQNPAGPDSKDDGQREDRGTRRFSGPLQYYRERREKWQSSRPDLTSLSGPTSTGLIDLSGLADVQSTPGNEDNEKEQARAWKRSSNPLQYYRERRERSRSRSQARTSSGFFPRLNKSSTWNFSSTEVKSTPPVPQPRSQRPRPYSYHDFSQQTGVLQHAHTHSTTTAFHAPSSWDIHDPATDASAHRPANVRDSTYQAPDSWDIPTDVASGAREPELNHPTTPTHQRPPLGFGRLSPPERLGVLPSPAKSLFAENANPVDMQRRRSMEGIIVGFGEGSEERLQDVPPVPAIPPNMERWVRRYSSDGEVDQVRADAGGNESGANDARNKTIRSRRKSLQRAEYANAPPVPPIPPGLEHWKRHSDASAASAGQKQRRSMVDADAAQAGAEEPTVSRSGIHNGDQIGGLEGTNVTNDTRPEAGRSGMRYEHGGDGVAQSTNTQKLEDSNQNNTDMDGEREVGGQAHGKRMSLGVDKPLPPLPTETISVGSDEHQQREVLPAAKVEVGSEGSDDDDLPPAAALQYGDPAWQREIESRQKPRQSRGGVEGRLASSTEQLRGPEIGTEPSEEAQSYAAGRLKQGLHSNNSTEPEKPQRQESLEKASADTATQLEDANGDGGLNDNDLALVLNHDPLPGWAVEPGLDISPTAAAKTGGDVSPLAPSARLDCADEDAEPQHRGLNAVVQDSQHHGTFGVNPVNPVNPSVGSARPEAPIGRQRIEETPSEVAERFSRPQAASCGEAGRELQPAELGRNANIYHVADPMARRKAGLPSQTAVEPPSTPTMNGELISPTIARSRDEFALELEKAFTFGSQAPAPSEISPTPQGNGLAYAPAAPAPSASQPSVSPYQVVHAVQYNNPSQSSLSSWDQDSVAAPSQSEGSQFGDKAEGRDIPPVPQVPSAVQPRQENHQENFGGPSHPKHASNMTATNGHLGVYHQQPMLASHQYHQAPVSQNQQQPAGTRRSQSLLSAISSAVSDDRTPVSPTSSTAGYSRPSSRGHGPQRSSARDSPVPPQIQEEPTSRNQKHFSNESYSSYDLYADHNGVVRGMQDKQGQPLRVKTAQAPDVSPSNSPRSGATITPGASRQQNGEEEDTTRYSEERPMSFISGSRDQDGRPQDEINMPTPAAEKNIPPVPQIPLQLQMLQQQNQARQQTGTPVSSMHNISPQGSMDARFQGHPAQSQQQGAAVVPVGNQATSPRRDQRAPPHGRTTSQSTVSPPPPSHASPPPQASPPQILAQRSFLQNGAAPDTTLQDPRLQAMSPQDPRMQGVPPQDPRLQQLRGQDPRAQNVPQRQESIEQENRLRANPQMSGALGHPAQQDPRLQGQLQTGPPAQDPQMQGQPGAPGQPRNLYEQQQMMMMQQRMNSNPQMQAPGFQQQPGAGSAGPSPAAFQNAKPEEKEKEKDQFRKISSMFKGISGNIGGKKKGTPPPQQQQQQQPPQGTPQKQTSPQPGARSQGFLHFATHGPAKAQNQQNQQQQPQVVNQQQVQPQSQQRQPQVQGQQHVQSQSQQQQPQAQVQQQAPMQSPQQQGQPQSQQMFMSFNRDLQGQVQNPQQQAHMRPPQQAQVQAPQQQIQAQNQQQSQVQSQSQPSQSQQQAQPRGEQPAQPPILQRAPTQEEHWPVKQQQLPAQAQLQVQPAGQQRNQQLTADANRLDDPHRTASFQSGISGISTLRPSEQTSVRRPEGRSETTSPAPLQHRQSIAESQISHVSGDSTRVEAAESRLDLRHPTSPAPFRGIPPPQAPPGAPAQPRQPQAQQTQQVQVQQGQQVQHGQQLQQLPSQSQVPVLAQGPPQGQQQRPQTGHTMSSGPPEAGKKKRSSLFGTLFSRGNTTGHVKASKDQKKAQKTQQQGPPPAGMQRPPAQGQWPPPGQHPQQYQQHPQQYMQHPQQQAFRPGQPGQPGQPGMQYGPPPAGRPFPGMGPPATSPQSTSPQAQASQGTSPFGHPSYQQPQGFQQPGPVAVPLPNGVPQHYQQAPGVPRQQLQPMQQMPNGAQQQFVQPQQQQMLQQMQIQQQQQQMLQRQQMQAQQHSPQGAQQQYAPAQSSQKLQAPAQQPSFAPSAVQDARQPVQTRPAEQQVPRVTNGAVPSSPAVRQSLDQRSEASSPAPPAPPLAGYYNPQETKALVPPPHDESPLQQQQQRPSAQRPSQRRAPQQQQEPQESHVASPTSPESVATIVPIEQEEEEEPPQPSVPFVEPVYETPEIPSAYNYVHGPYQSPSTESARTQPNFPPITQHSSVSGRQTAQSPSIQSVVENTRLPSISQHEDVSAPHSESSAAQTPVDNAQSPAVSRQTSLSRQNSEPQMETISPQVSNLSQAPHPRTHSDASTVSVISPVSDPSPGPSASQGQPSLYQRAQKSRMSSIVEQTQHERAWNLDLPPGATEQQIIHARHQQYIKDQFATNQQLHEQRMAQSPSPHLSRHAQSPSPHQVASIQPPPQAQQPIYQGHSVATPPPQQMRQSPAPSAHSQQQIQPEQQAPRSPHEVFQRAQQQLSQGSPPRIRKEQHSLQQEQHYVDQDQTLQPKYNSPPKQSSTPQPQDGFREVLPRHSPQPYGVSEQSSPLHPGQSPPSHHTPSPQQPLQPEPIHPDQSLQPAQFPLPMSPPPADVKSPINPQISSMPPPPLPRSPPAPIGPGMPTNSVSPLLPQQQHNPDAKEEYGPPPPPQQENYDDQAPDEPPPEYEGPGVQNDGMDKSQPHRPPNIMTNPEARGRERDPRSRQPSIGILQHPQPASMAASPQRSQADMGAENLRRQLLQQEERDRMERLQRQQQEREESARERQEREAARARARELERSVSGGGRVGSLRSVAGSRAGTRTGWERRGSSSAGGAMPVFELPAIEDDEPVMRATSFPGQEWVPTFTED